MKLIDISYRTNNADAKCYVSKNFKNMDYTIQMDCLSDAISELEDIAQNLRKEYMAKLEKNDRTNS
tara:strand:+ start:1646 stop:1843 length:198 start_codon:yes stop_codon:yes gene_type:complete